ncbi:hypothetical protein L202_06652 [Cryptococcus amylolentus CBS 6039]|uniref:F-box domain-containing protein n=2 Tax=Cryptococcus amylolentus TaxID=104669 RepID=A0A1E3HIF7_9TREE|nr:hypothetical protein L202_06652 [Cryptococcus amylolentus CBS 6039]ODN75526.1 hypothetical protein L202_06652 [Cryptococcus amylolentus CBS 6039]ODO03233.1 hypothetical protein I350_06078 [Cryptococcus amylolentus CBS 6273]
MSSFPRRNSDPIIPFPSRRGDSSKSRQAALPQPFDTGSAGTPATSLAGSLSRLSVATPDASSSTPSYYPSGDDESRPPSRAVHKRMRVLRKPSHTVSATSDSEDEDEGIEGEEGIDVDEEAKTWLLRGEEQREMSETKKGKRRDDTPPRGMAETLPPEILLQIFKYLPANHDLLSALLVSRPWCLCAFSLLWHKPSIPTIAVLGSIARVLNSPNRSLPYANAVKRLHLLAVTPYLGDGLFEYLSVCTKVERMNLTGATKLSAKGLATVLGCMPNMVSLDLTNVIHTDDSVMKVIGERNTKLQAINLSDCKLVGDDGVLALVEHNKLLRRVKFDRCHRISPKSLIPLIRSNPLVLEYDFQELLTLSDAVLHCVFLHAPHLRELRISGCTALTENCIPDLEELTDMSEDEIVACSERIGLQPDPLNGVLGLRPSATSFDSLRVVDMTGCTSLGDQAIDNLVTNAPKLRQLTLNKCSSLTDKSLDSIGRLGKHLHNLHLGHVSTITDKGVINLARSCSRIRYLDLACCTNLTDACVAEIGESMPKLKRFGLVKVNNITDEALYALVKKHTTLERVHLSYCEQLTIKGVAFMLNRLNGLKHLSLTGVSSFRVQELQSFCRPPPESFNEHQRAAFCVFSGSRVNDLTSYLNEYYIPNMDANDTSEDSGAEGPSSSTSSLTVPGASHAPSPAGPRYRTAPQPPLHPSLVYRRSLTHLRDQDAWRSISPGIPSEAFRSSPGVSGDLGLGGGNPALGPGAGTAAAGYPTIQPPVYPAYHTGPQYPSPSQHLVAPQQPDQFRDSSQSSSQQSLQRSLLGRFSNGPGAVVNGGETRGRPMGPRAPSGSGPYPRYQNAPPPSPSSFATAQAHSAYGSARPPSLNAFQSAVSTLGNRTQSVDRGQGSTGLEAGWRGHGQAQGQGQGQGQSQGGQEGAGRRPRWFSRLGSNR